MKINVRLFADLRDYLPPGSERYSCLCETADGARVGDVLDQLNIPEDVPKIILLNGVHVDREEHLKEGDVMSVFPPIAGG